MHKEFQTNPLNATGQAREAQLREAFDALLTMIESTVPAGRELAFCKTELERACFYALKAASFDLASTADPRTPPDYR